MLLLYEYFAIETPRILFEQLSIIFAAIICEIKNYKLKMYNNDFMYGSVFLLI